MYMVQRDRVFAQNAKHDILDMWSEVRTFVSSHPQGRTKAPDDLNGVNRHLPSFRLKFDGECDKFHLQRDQSSQTPETSHQPCSFWPHPKSSSILRHSLRHATTCVRANLTGLNSGNHSLVYWFSYFCNRMMRMYYGQCCSNAESMEMLNTTPLPGNFHTALSRTGQRSYTVGGRSFREKRTSSER